MSINVLPTTSTNADIEETGFKKFRDDLRPNRRALKRQQKSQSIGQTMTKKILLSIRRRQLKDVSIKSSSPSVTRRKLSFVQNNSKIVKSASPRKTKKCKRLAQLSITEEGEIRSDTEDDTSDDDCIYVEPQVEQIVIDDEIAPTQQVSRIINIREKNMGVIATSTPYVGRRSTPYVARNIESSLPPKEMRIIKTAPTTPVEIKNEESALFFEDAVPTGRFNNTLPADYTTLSTLREHSTPTCRSVRLKCMATTSDIIEIDDTACEVVKCENKTLDDSVIFVGETVPNSFIPLNSNKKSLKRIKEVDPQKKKLAVANTLFSSSEKKQLKAYNNNAYNPNAGEEVQTKKRLVIIDASNVAYNHAINKEFSVKGLKISIDFFEKMGHEVKAIVPRFRLHKNKTSDHEMMDELFNSGKIVITPCKSLPDNKVVTSYDDRFILQLACELDAAIVSNDNYRDLIHENAAFKKIIENRVISYTWFNDVFILPKDPYGKWGPSLSAILNRN